MRFLDFYFTLARFCLGAFLGAGLPLLAATPHARIMLWLAAWIPMQATLAHAFLLPAACTLGGIAVGAIFSRKSFIWGILLTAHLLLARRKLL